MILHFLILQFYFKNEQNKTNKKKPFLRKKAEEKQNSATTMIFVDGKR